MILRKLENTPAEPDQAGFRPAWKAFVESQQLMEPPYAIILQPEHSLLAGNIAALLNPDIFGDLSSDVIDAIREHDIGWQEQDQRSLEQGHHIPFPMLAPEQYVPIWEECVRQAGAKSATRGFLISRHFCALADDHPGLRDFFKAETEKRQEAERHADVAREDLDRFTAALGFCDLLSLLLCSGVTERVALPLAHPSLPEAHKAGKVLLEWQNGNPRFSSAVVRGGATVSIDVRQQSRSGLQPLRLSWTFAV